MLISIVVYQQSLQLAVIFLQKLSDDPDGLIDENLKTNLQEYLGPSSSDELQWLSDCLIRGIRDFLEVEKQRRFLRLPLVLAEQNYVADLRRGAALRSLRRVFMACRVERVIGSCVDAIISSKYFSLIPCCLILNYSHMTFHESMYQNLGMNSLRKGVARQAIWQHWILI